MEGAVYGTEKNGWAEDAGIKNQLLLLPPNFSLECDASPGDGTYALVLPKNDQTRLVVNGVENGIYLFLDQNGLNGNDAGDRADPALGKTQLADLHELVNLPVDPSSDLLLVKNSRRSSNVGPEIVSGIADQKTVQNDNHFRSVSIERPVLPPPVVNKGEAPPRRQEPEIRTTRSGRVCKLSKKVKQNLDDVKPAAKIDKRPPVACKQCNESFIGVKNLWRHLVQHPDHGSLPDKGEELEKVLKNHEKVTSSGSSKDRAKMKRKAPPEDVGVGLDEVMPISGNRHHHLQRSMQNGDGDKSSDNRLGSSAMNHVNGVSAKDAHSHLSSARGRSPSTSMPKSKEAVDAVNDDVEAMKQAFVKKCEDLSLGDLFVVRTESNAGETEPASSLSTPYGRRFLAMLKDLERLVDALKYAAELSFVLEESDLEEGVLKVEGTLSDILAIAEGVYKPVCDVKEIMVLVREKLKKDADQRQSKFGLVRPRPPEKPPPPVEKPFVSTNDSSRPVKRKKVVKIKKVKKPVLSAIVKESKRESSISTVGPAPSMPIVRTPSPAPVLNMPIVSSPSPSRQMTSLQPTPQLTIVSSSSPTTNATVVSEPLPMPERVDVVSTVSATGGIELTIDAVIQGMEDVRSSVTAASSSSVGMYCHGGPLPAVTIHDRVMMPHMMAAESGVGVDGTIPSSRGIDLPSFMNGSEDSNVVPTESLSPSLKVVDDNVTKDAMTILSEDINEASNSSDIGSVLIPVTEKNVVESHLLGASSRIVPPSFASALPSSVPCSDYGPIQEVVRIDPPRLEVRRESMDDYLPPPITDSDRRQNHSKKKCPVKRMYAASKVMKTRKAKENISAAPVSAGNEFIQQSLRELRAKSNASVPDDSRTALEVLQVLPAPSPCASDNLFVSVDSGLASFSPNPSLQLPPVTVSTLFDHEPFLNPNSLRRSDTCNTPPAPSPNHHSHPHSSQSDMEASGIARRLDFSLSMDLNGGLLSPSRPKRPLSRSPPVRPPSTCSVCISDQQSPSLLSSSSLLSPQCVQMTQRSSRNGYPYNYKNPIPYPLIGSPDKLSALPSHMISSYPKYRVASASSGSALCTVVDSSRKAVSPGLSIRLPATGPCSPIPQAGPLPSPGRMSIRSPHPRLRPMSGEDEVESELDDSDREVDNHGIDSDLESVTTAFVEGRLVTRPPDAHSENSNSSVVDFEQLMRDIDIPVDLNYFPPVSTTVPLFRSQSPSASLAYNNQHHHNPCRNPGIPLYVVDGRLCKRSIVGDAALVLC